MQNYYIEWLLQPQKKSFSFCFKSTQEVLWWYVFEFWQIYFGCNNCTWVFFIWSLNLGIFYYILRVIFAIARGSPSPAFLLGFSFSHIYQKTPRLRSTHTRPCGSLWLVNAIKVCPFLQIIWNTISCQFKNYACYVCYCSLPPGGLKDVLASLLGCLNVFYIGIMVLWALRKAIRCAKKTTRWRIWSWFFLVRG